MQATKVLHQLVLRGNRGHPVRLNQVRYNNSDQYKYPEVTMNDLPTPEGDWYTLNNARQNRNNMQLVGGVGFAVLSLAFGIATNMFQFYDDMPDITKAVDCYQE